MPDFYGKVDCVMVSSVYESCSLPLLESAAAGRLPMSTNVGITENLPNTPGFLLPMEADHYVEKGTAMVTVLKDSPALFHSKCKEAQEYAREYYDWSKVVENWAKLIVG